MHHNNYLNQKKAEYFYRQFYPLVFHVACLYARDIHLTEDIAQETFCKALKNIHQLNDQGKIKAWLIRIATNTASDFLKLEARYLIPEDPAFIYQVASERPLEDEVIKREKTLTLQQAGEKISLRLRQVLLLRYQAELSLEEISAELDVPFCNQFIFFTGYNVSEFIETVVK